MRNRRQVAFVLAFIAVSARELIAVEPTTISDVGNPLSRAKTSQQLASPLAPINVSSRTQINVAPGPKIVSLPAQNQEPLPHRAVPLHLSAAQRVPAARVPPAVARDPARTLNIALTTPSDIEPPPAAIGRWPIWTWRVALLAIISAFLVLYRRAGR